MLPRRDGRSGLVLAGAACETWQLLSTPIAVDELAAALSERCSGVGLEESARVVRRVLAELGAEGLVDDVT